MALAFFSALNPISESSGIVYCLAGGESCQGKEMIDRLVVENISNAFSTDLDYLSGLDETFNILYGNHYDLNLNGREDAKGGSKGVLDFFIFPLIARKLIADTYLHERRERFFSNILAWTIAIPFEYIRFSAAIALTLLLAPIVAVVHIVKSFLPKDDVENTVNMDKSI